MKPFTLLAAAAGFAATASAATATPTAMGVQQPSSRPIKDQPVVQGCFSSSGDLVFNSTQTFNSRGECGQTICQAAGFLVAASTEGDKCYCGNKYPPNSTLVDDSKCDVPCTGYGIDACGGDGFFTVYNTGIELYDVDSSDGTTSTSASSSATTSTKPTSVATTVVGGQTVFVTQTSTSETGSSKSSGPNTAGIAGGVVAGVVVVAAIVGGVFFMMRRRRNREIEEEHRRNAAVSAFFTGGKAPSANGDQSSSDARLDPVMAQRRMSDGSIADNEDYSRRILRVRNA